MLRLKQFKTPALSLFLALAVVASGCSGKSKDGAGSGNDLVSPTPTFDEDTGAVEGSVLSVEQLPIADAEVGLLTDPPVVTRTAADGKFVFSNLAPATYQVHIQKFGYHPVVRPVTVLAGEVQRLDVALVAQAPEGVGYVVPLEPIPGRLACSFSVAGLVAGNCKIIGFAENHPVESAWTDLTGGDHNFIDLPTLVADAKVLESDRLATVVLEATWTPGTAAASTFLLALEQLYDHAAPPDGNATDAATYATSVGGPGVKLVATPGQAGPYEPQPTNPVAMPADPLGFSVMVVPWAQDDPVVLPLQQEFQLWFTLFFNVEAPKDYSALASP